MRRRETVKPSQEQLKTIDHALTAVSEAVADVADTGGNSTAHAKACEAASLCRVLLSSLDGLCGTLLRGKA